MTIEEVSNSEHHLASLDAYTASFSPSEFLQSSTWFKFQEALDHKVKLFHWQEGNQEAYFLAIETKLPLNRSYYYIPRGPLVADEEVWQKLLTEFVQYLKTNSRAVFIRFEPNDSFTRLAGSRRVLDIQPSHSFHTDLTQDEKVLLAAMHPKTRYNIKLALKNGLIFDFDDTKSDEFFALMHETARRDKFKSHSENYYKTMIESGVVSLATVRDDQGILAAGLFASCGQTMVYLHGASSSRRREIMAPYALHWEMMMKAKSAEQTIYDWHGVDDSKWPGFSRFKRGFGGHDFLYPGTFDYPLDRIAYAGYTVMRSLRRIF
jgi:lipid II:glycine glycyltransferase (peptidoglycan interpeptide bridge formation enzyme)